MKLYLWEGVLRDYTSGVMFALANSPDQARELLKAECAFIPEDELNTEPAVIERPFGFVLWGGG